jgi:hypothetical protein
MGFSSDVCEWISPGISRGGLRLRWTTPGRGLRLHRVTAGQSTETGDRMSPGRTGTACSSHSSGSGIAISVRMNTFRVDFGQFSLFFAGCHECIDQSLVLAQGSGGIPRSDGSGADGLFAGFGVV